MKKIWNYLKKRKKNDRGERKKKKVFSQTYILYDKAGVVKPTFVSKLEQYVNIFSQFTIFCEKSDKNPKNFTKNNKKYFFRLKNNYTGEKEFSLALRKLDGSPAKFFSREISVEFLIKPRQNRRKKMYISCGHFHGFGNTRPDSVGYLKPRVYRY